MTTTFGGASNLLFMKKCEVDWQRWEGEQHPVRMPVSDESLSQTLIRSMARRWESWEISMGHNLMDLPVGQLPRDWGVSHTAPPLGPYRV